MLKLKRLEIKDFLSHHDTSLEFAPGDKVLLDGVSGAGKSTIVEALIWCLYGIGRTDGRALVRRGARKAVVTVLLEEDGTTYEITRGVTANGKSALTALRRDGDVEKIIDGGVRVIQDWIERDVLHASYELFINSVAYPQGNRENFVNATSVRRKELLLEILKTVDTEEYVERIRTAHTEKSQRRSLLGGRLEAVELSINEATQRIAGAKDIEKNRSACESSLAEVEGVIERHGATLASLEQAFSTIENDLLRADVLSEAVASWEFLDGDETVLRGWADMLGQSLDALSSATEQNNRRAAILSERPSTRDYTVELESIEKRIRFLVDEQPVCPSGDACPYYARITPELKQLYSERERLTLAEAEQRQAVALWEYKLESVGPRIDTTKLTEDVGNAKKAEMALELRELRMKLGNPPTKEQIALERKLVEGARQSAASLRESIAALSGKIAYIAQVKNDLERFKDEHSSYVKEIAGLDEQVKLLVELRDAFGPNGITAVALDYLLPTLEERINEVLGQLSDFRIRLDTQREGAASRVEGLFIVIRNGQGEEFSYDSYSGGEKLKVTVAISEALASLQNVGFRVLDELFVGLDEDSTEAFAHVLGQIQGRFSQMLCVSHLRQIKDMFPRQVVVAKLDGISKIV